jgi:predicted dehydrogenase
VGFNRRFSLYAQAVKQALQGPVMLNYRMNAGFLPAEHWVHGREGGGRIVGEACHIIDLFRYLTDSAVRAVSVAALRPRKPYQSADNKIITLQYANGSVGSINYFANGAGELPKETLEAHWQGKSLLIDNYQKLCGYGVTLPGISKADKGQKELLRRVGQALLAGGPWPIALEEILETSYLSIMAQEAD